MTTRHGKIARLPKQIREQLNLRLDNGETAAALVKWLNTLPEVQKIVTEQFAGHPIRPQNLSQWRNGGYLDWLRHQQLREQTRWTTEQSCDLNTDIDANTISIAENVAMIMSAELALHVQALLGIKNPKQRFRQFCHLSRELSRMRRDDQRALRTQMRLPQTQPTLKQEESEPAPEPVEQLETQNPEPETVAQPETSEPPLDTCHSPLVTPEPQPETQNPEPETIAQTETSDPQSETQNSKLETIGQPETIEPNCHYPWPLTSQLAPLNYPAPLPPIPQNPTKSVWKKQLLPIRGRRFVCVEG